MLAGVAGNEEGKVVVSLSSFIIVLCKTVELVEQEGILNLVCTW